jgi:fumarate hydratase class I
MQDPEASSNDRFVALELLKNANIAAGGLSHPAAAVSLVCGGKVAGTQLCAFSQLASHSDGLLGARWMGAGMVLPGCQDTGTGIIIGKRGQFVWTDGHDEEHLSKGIFRAYTETNLRYSQVHAVGFYTLLSMEGRHNGMHSN